jgi:hypothetical protein
LFTWLIPFFPRSQMDLRGLAGVAARGLTLLVDDVCTSKEAWNRSGRLAFVSEMNNRDARASGASKSFDPDCRRNPSNRRKVLTRLAKREGDIEIGMSSLAKRCGKTRARAARRMNHWQVTSNTMVVSRKRRWKSCERRWPNSVARSGKGQYFPGCF